MKRAGRKHCALPGGHHDLLFPDLGAKCSSFHLPLFALKKMNVKRRAARSWRQGSLEVQNDLTLRVTHSPHPQDLSSVAVLDCQVIHATVLSHAPPAQTKSTLRPLESPRRHSPPVASRE